jgi:alanine or glycine:cation symporter, AGCS family
VIGRLAALVLCASLGLLGAATPALAGIDAGAAVVPEEASEEASIGQRIDDVFRPVAEKAADVMFWDPFAALGLYDPVLYGDDGQPLRDADGEIRRTRVPIVVLWLVFVSLFFTLRLGLINVRGFGHAIGLINGRYTDPTAPGQITHFQALATAVSGTVGLGNIAGVAIAMAIGGPGATFWMIVAGFLGMAAKFAECTLAVKYRQIAPSGDVSGGPMYYLSRGLARRNLPRLGKSLAVLWATFAIFGSLGGGNMFQANQAFSLAAETFPFLEGQELAFGLLLAAAIGMVIIGGIEGIGKVTGRIVPVMAATYILSCLVIIGMNITAIGDALSLIVRGAFSAEAAQGGILGVMVVGLTRAAFSSETGVGTAAIAHSTAKTREPVAEGMVALHEPFIDTVVICTMTALVLIFTGHYEAGPGVDGAALTAAAFGSVASWYPYILTLSILLFSFSTQIAFSYYGVKCFDYVAGPLFERVLSRRELATHVYRVIFLACVVVGAAASLDAVIAYTDMVLYGMIVTNTIGLFVLAPEIRADLISYLRRLRSGEIAPRPRQGS